MHHTGLHVEDRVTYANEYTAYILRRTNYPCVSINGSMELPTSVIEFVSCITSDNSKRCVFHVNRTLR